MAPINSKKQHIKKPQQGNGSGGNGKGSTGSRFIPGNNTNRQTKKPEIVEKQCRIISATVLIQDPGAVSVLAQNSNVILCPYFFEDIKKLRQQFVKYPFYKYAVDEALKALEKLQVKKSLSKGKIEINKHFSLYFYGMKKLGSYDIPKSDPIVGIQNFIQYLKDEYEYVKVSYISKDSERRAELVTNGVDAQDYKNHQTDVGSSMVYNDAFDLHKVDSSKFAPNTYIIVKDKLYYWNGKKISIVTLQDTTVYGIEPLNIQLQALMHALLQKDIRLITVQGVFGTGKSFSPVLSAIKQITEGLYKKFMVTRAMIPLEGEEVGILPGGVDEKIAPWMAGVFDNIEDIESLIREKSPDLLKEPEVVTPPVRKRSKKTEDETKSGGKKKNFIQEFRTKIRPNPMGLMRGASLQQTFFFIDEAQNLFPSHMRVLLSRLGMSSKAVVAGDNNQIDHPHLDAKSNGFTRAINHYLHEPYAAHIVLIETERSDIAAKAASL